VFFSFPPTFWPCGQRGKKKEREKEKIARERVPNTIIPNSSWMLWGLLRVQSEIRFFNSAARVGPPLLVRLEISNHNFPAIPSGGPHPPYLGAALLHTMFLKTKTLASKKVYGYSLGIMFFLNTKCFGKWNASLCVCVRNNRLVTSARPGLPWVPSHGLKSIDGLTLLILLDSLEHGICPFPASHMIILQIWHSIWFTYNSDGVPIQSSMKLK
jgi:hypothetical protein